MFDERRARVKFWSSISQPTFQQLDSFWPVTGLPLLLPPSISVTPFFFSFDCGTVTGRSLRLGLTQSIHHDSPGQVSDAVTCQSVDQGLCLARFRPSDAQREASIITEHHHLAARDASWGRRSPIIFVGRVILTGLVVLSGS